jgi:alpha-tubulin suppressor-like RCC1 family protein
VALALTAAAPPAWAGTAAQREPAGEATAVTGALGGAAVVSAGGYHTCALTAGGVKCWGQNDHGQVGDGSWTSRVAPVDVSGLSSGVAAVAAGWQHTCALLTGGGVKCWGKNDLGQLGNGTTIQRNVPVDVSGLANVAAIAAAGGRTCVLTATGGVKCWGVGVTSPADVVGLESGVTAIVAGGGEGPTSTWGDLGHSCALTEAGGVKCWGNNAGGQLGDGTFTYRAALVEVIGLSSGVTAISAGWGQTCALTAAGGTQCWGGGSPAPADVAGLTSGVAAVSAGGGHACALMTTGSVKCWGSNNDGQLGDGTNGSRATLVAVIGLGSSVSAIAAGGRHTCAVVNGDGIRCWGYNGYGQLGNGFNLWRPSPVEVVGLGSGVAAIAAGWDHSCAVTAAGGALCWGGNHVAQLGDGTNRNFRYWPAWVSGLSSGVRSISAGGWHTCALTTAGGVKCWGDNGKGQLGDGTITQRPTPVGVGGLESGVAAVTAGQEHTCALMATGGLRCWGSNYAGQLGAGTTTDWYVPLDVLGLSSGVTAVSAGSAHTCALTSAGGVKCWGSNSSGQVDPSIYGIQTLPQDVAGLGSGMAAVAAGALHTCALTVAGGVKCWGYNAEGQLGDGTREPRNTIVDVVGLDSAVMAIAVSRFHSCAFTSAGGVKCWGNGITVPAEVGGLTSGVTALAQGGNHTCVMTVGGGVKCWGYNGAGQVGVDPGWNPVMVVGFESYYRVLAPLLWR